MADGPHSDRAALARGQLEQLRSLVAELFPANGFYRRKLGAAGVTFDVASLADFSRRFPLTTKAELVADQQAFPPYGTNLTYPLNCYTRCHQTSGTSGVPLRWLDTPENWDWLVENWTETYRAAGVTAADRVYFAFSFGPFIGFWLAFEAAGRLGAMCLPGGGLGTPARLRGILELGATVLCCTPTYALRLAEVAAAEHLDLRSGQLRTVIVAGEPGGSVPATRARFAALWPGARFFDHHGMTEVGPVTFECPARPGVLHVLESAYYAEIIPPAGTQPIAPGETGELILTTLGRTGSPLLRYRTGDLVRAEVRPDPAAPCACGRHDLALLGGILGRTDDMVVVRGVNVYPAAVEATLRAESDLAEYRVTVATVQAMAELRLELEARPECADPDALAERIRQAFLTQFALRVPVTLVSAGALPRFEMKARRWTRAD